MTPAAILAILVATGEAHAAPTTAMAAAAAEVIGDPRGVRVVEASALADTEALRVERELGTRAVVALAWADADHLRARLRLHAARTDRWIDRELDFASGDTPAERGRALGFAMASMLPEGDPTLPLATREPPPAPEPARAAPLGANALEAAFLGGAGIGGPAGGLGGRLAFERFLARRASIGLSLAGRSGRIDDLDASVVTASAGLGGALWPIAPARDRRFGLGIRGEALLIYEAVGHTDAAGAMTWKGQALPGGSLSLSGTFRLAGPLELVVAARAEVAFGTVDVTVLAARPPRGTAQLPAARALGEAGLRVRF
jgi:hypothetical protein